MQKLYAEDGLRDKEFLQSLLAENFILQWESTDGYHEMNKQAILNLADELNANYKFSDVDIYSIIEDNNKVAVHYLHKVSTLETPNYLIPIAKVMVIWEFEEATILKGYQISKLA